MKDAEFQQGFLTDLALVTLFAVLGIGLYAWQLFKNVKKAGKQERVVAQQPVAARPEHNEAPASIEAAQPEQPQAQPTESENASVSGDDKAE